MRNALNFAGGLLLTACDEIGGGIAGASWDSKGAIEEVERYPQYAAPSVEEVVLRNHCHGRSVETWAGISQHFDDILRSFEFSVPEVGSKPVVLPEPGLVASYDGRTFTVERDGSTVIREQLPAVFSDRPMHLAVDTLNGRRVIFVASRSRASTGRRFVALYTVDGQPLYRDVLIAWQLWDVEHAGDHIDLLGCSETRRLSIQRDLGKPPS